MPPHRHSLRQAAILLVAAFLCGVVDGRQINWRSPTGRVNTTSDGTPLDTSFVFELGSFADGFEPTALNRSEWAAHWVVVGRTAYRTSDQAFSDTHVVTTFDPETPVGRDVYIWGHNTLEGGNNEWFMARKSDWNWPSPAPLSLPLTWVISGTPEVVAGTLGGSEDAFFIKMEDVGNAPNPKGVPSNAKDSYARWAIGNSFTGDAALPESEEGKADGGNPDGDIYDNLLEYAFCQDPSDGRVDAPPFRVEVNSSTDPITFEAHFLRPEGGLTDVTYALQARTTLPQDGDNWTTLMTVPGQGNGGDAGIVITSQGDGRERVSLLDITDSASVGDVLLGFEDAVPQGFVRLVVELDHDGELGTDATSATMVQGWKATDFTQGQCETYAYPWLQHETLSGSVEAVNGVTIVVAGLPDLSATFSLSSAHYLEVVAGDHEGHRFDIVSGDAGGLLTLAPDGDLCAGPPFNTSLTVPATLVGDRFIVRQHQTVSGLFAPSRFTAEVDPVDADRLLIYHGGTTPWKSLYVDESSEWRDEATAGAAGNDILPPTQGFFIHPQATGGTTRILGMGIVRENATVCPLQSGYTLLSGAYPMATSFVDRGLDDLANPVTGSLDPAHADQVHFWAADGHLGVDYQNRQIFTCYFRVEGTIPGLPAFASWSDANDVNLTPADDQAVFPSDRCAFYFRVDPTCLDTHTLPVPWSP